MKFIVASMTWLLAFTVAVSVFTGTGVLAAEPGDGETGEGESQYGTFFWVGIGAVVGIATVAIWQGINDANKKKEEAQAREAEDKEIEDFDEYFRSITAEEASGSGDNDTDENPEPEFVKPLAEPFSPKIGISRILK
jgi:hypothetical protein